MRDGKKKVSRMGMGTGNGDELGWEISFCSLCLPFLGLIFDMDLGCLPFFLFERRGPFCVISSFFFVLGASVYLLLT